MFHSIILLTMKIDTAAAITGLPLCGGCHDTRSSINSPHRRVRSNFPPPEGDDAISPRSPLRPPRKSFAFALRTAVSPPGRCIGTRKCRNVKPLRFRDTALAVLLRYLLRRPVIEPLPLSHTLLPASRSETDLCSNCLCAVVRSFRFPHEHSRQYYFHWLH